MIWFCFSKFQITLSGQMGLHLFDQNWWNSLNRFDNYEFCLFFLFFFGMNLTKYILCFFKFFSLVICFCNELKLVTCSCWSGAGWPVLSKSIEGEVGWASSNKQHEDLTYTTAEQKVWCWNESEIIFHVYIHKSNQKSLHNSRTNKHK